MKILRSLMAVDGENIKAFARKDSESGKFSICFRVRNTDEYNKTVWISSLETFLANIGCKNNRSTASGYEWTGGSIDLFNAKVTVDPVHSCEFKIETQSLLGGNEFVISG
jgi:hypothetical protein